MRAKLVAFTWPAQRVLRQFPLSDTSLPARYARAIVAYRSQTPAEAQRQIDALIQSDPADPYFFELKGQALLEDGNASGCASRRSARPSRSPPMPRSSRYCSVRRWSALDKPAPAQEAIDLLNIALAKEPDMGPGYRALGRAYAMTGNEPMAQLATAQGLFAEGGFADARIQATSRSSQIEEGIAGMASRRRHCVV